MVFMAAVFRMATGQSKQWFVWEPKVGDVASSGTFFRDGELWEQDIVLTGAIGVSMRRRGRGEDGITVARHRRSKDTWYLKSSHGRFAGAVSELQTRGELYISPKTRRLRSISIAQSGQRFLRAIDSL